MLSIYICYYKFSELMCLHLYFKINIISKVKYARQSKSHPVITFYKIKYVIIIIIIFLFIIIKRFITTI